MKKLRRSNLSKFVGEAIRLLSESSLVSILQPNDTVIYSCLSRRLERDESFGVRYLFTGE